MINKARQKQDAANAALHALSSTQGPTDALIKRLQALAAENPDIAGVVTFVERTAQLEKTLSARITTLTRERDEARVFDMRKAGVRAEDLPDVSWSNAGNALSTYSNDPWEKYEQMKKKDPVAAQDFYDRNLRVQNRKP